MGLAYRQTLRHRLGIDDLAQAAGRLRANLWETGRFVELLAEDPGLDRAALLTITGVIGDRDVAPLRWALVDAGLITEALAVPVKSRPSHLHAIDDRLAAGKLVPDAMIAGALAFLDDLDLEEELLLAIQAAAVLGPWIAPARRAAVLEELGPRAAAAEAAGAWEELDFAYGTVDPTLELARAVAHHGDEAAVDALLDGRAARFAELLNLEEAHELRALCRARGEAHRSATWERVRGWAGDDLDDDGTPGEQVAWLVETLDDPWSDAPERLAALVPQLGVQGLAAIATAARGRPLGDAAEHALVAATEAAIAHVPDARAIRDASTGAWALADARALSTDEDATIARAAAAWAAHVATVDTCDWNPLVNTALAFARRWRAAIEPAAVRLRAEETAAALLDYDHWARLYDPDDVRARVG